ncbi:MAG: hypothetical protein ACQGQO_01125 [Sphaerochaetaceae bacterium]
MNYRYIAQQLRHIMQEIDDARTNCELIDNIDDITDEIQELIDDVEDALE